MGIKMQKPSKDEIRPNFFQCPNVLIDKFMSELSGSDLKCYLTIIRQTTGWHKKEDRISISQFVNFTGLSNRSVIDSCRRLVMVVGRLTSNTLQSFWLKAVDWWRYCLQARRVKT